MTGLENNAHAIGLVCYAPLLCNVDYINWQPDMIWFDSLDRKSTRLNSSHMSESRMPSSA